MCMLNLKKLRNSIQNLQKYFLQALLILSSSLLYFPVLLLYLADLLYWYWAKLFISLTTPSFSLCVCIDQVIWKLPLPFPLSFFFSQVFSLILLLLNHKISEEKWQKGIATFWNYFLGNGLFMFCKCLLNVLYSWSSNMQAKIVVYLFFKAFVSQ